MRNKDFTAARAAWYASRGVPKEGFSPGFPPGFKAVISQRICVQDEENRLFLDGAAGAGRAWGSLEQRGLH